MACSCLYMRLFVRLCVCDVITVIVYSAVVVLSIPSRAMLVWLHDDEIYLDFLFEEAKEKKFRQEMRSMN